MSYLKKKIIKKFNGLDIELASFSLFIASLLFCLTMAIEWITYFINK